MIILLERKFEETGKTYIKYYSSVTVVVYFRSVFTYALITP